MKTFFLTITAVILSITSYSQQLSTKKGNVYDSNNKLLSKDEVRKLLASKPKLLDSYNTGITKASTGGVLSGLGAGFIIGDLLGSLLADRVYPTAFTYVGAGFLVVGIPVSIGYKKKISKAIDGYNESLLNNKTTYRVEKLTLIASNNSVGMRFSF
jgi:hypothetical protein